MAWDVVDVDHGDALEPLRRGLAKFRDPVIIDPKDGSEQVAVRHAVERQAFSVG